MRHNWKEIQKAHDIGLSFTEIQKKFNVTSSGIAAAKKRRKIVLRGRFLRNWKEVQAHYNEVKSIKETAKYFHMNVTDMYAAHHQGKIKILIGSPSSKTPKYDWSKIQEYYNNNHTISDIEREFGCANRTIVLAVQHKKLITRSRSEACKLRAKLKPRTHSDQVKKEISKRRRKFLKENPDKVPYLLNHSSKGVSYPEQYFSKIFEEQNIPVTFHYRVGTYELDFCLLDKKIDIEIDGEQHYTDSKIVASDLRRTKFLEQNGWRCLRIRWKDFKRLTFNERKEFIEEFLGLLKSIVGSTPTDPTNTWGQQKAAENPCKVLD